MRSELRWKYQGFSPLRLGYHVWFLGLPEPQFLPLHLEAGISIPIYLCSVHLLSCHRDLLLFPAWPQFLFLAPNFRKISHRDQPGHPAASSLHPIPMFSGGASMAMGTLLPLRHCVPYNFILRPVVMTWVLLH